MSVAPSSFATSLDRRIQMLRTAMGPLIAAALEDPDVVEVMLNPDRTLWVDRLSSGRAPMGVELSEADGERIIRLVAAHVGAEVHRGQPLLSAELPETGERFEGILPPAAPGPAFALRKRAIGVIPLERYVIDGMMTSAQAGFLVRVVRERQNVLIAGATSSGKTTLANLILRLYDLEGGRILIDGQDISTVTQNSLRGQIGVVSQDTALFHRSLRDNIKLGKPDASDDEVVAAARKAEAHDFIQTLADNRGRQGYDAFVGERGVKLSGGQRQRVAIARAMVMQPALLLADEPTGNLDSQAGAEVFSLLEELNGEGLTLIVVTHDASLGARAQRQLHMRDGRIHSTAPQWALA